MRTQVVLASGGLDSFATWFLFAPTSLNVFADVGQKYARKEVESLSRLQKLLPEFKCEYLLGPVLREYETASGIIPFRNAHLIELAAQYGDDILMGVLADEINSDKSVEFFDAMERVLNISHRAQYWTEGRTFTVTSPVRQMSKTELVAFYLRNDGPVHALQATVSCYDGSGEGHCGNCPSCFKRWVAFVNNDLNVGYFASSPLNYFHACIERKCHDGTYTEARADEILRAVKKGEGR